jgi:phospholipase C
VFLGRIAAVEDHALPDLGDAVYAFVPDIVGGNVAVANASTRALASAISSGTTNPYGVAVTPATASSLGGLQIWVTESGANTVSVFTYSTASQKWSVTQTIVVGIYPHGIAISPNGATAYVANTGPNTGSGGSQTVSVINTSSYQVTSTIEVGEAPQVLTVSPDGSSVAVACADGIYTIATSGGAVSKSRVDFHNPHGLAFSPDGSQIWVADSVEDQIVVLDARSLRGLDTIQVGRTPWGVAFSADGTLAYVTNTNEDTISVVSVSRLREQTKISLPPFQAENLIIAKSTYTQPHHQPGAIALNPGDGTIWVACNSSSSLAVIDPSSNTIVSAIEIGLGDDPVGIAFAGVS